MVKENDHVTIRRAMRNKTTLIETGTVLSIDGKKAVVSVDGPMGSKILGIRKTVSVDQLEPVSVRYRGSSRVNANPVKRFAR